MNNYYLIHSDLKPENVLLSPSGHVILTDFGLSKQFRISLTFTEKTSTFCGTAEYLAPEVLREEPYGYEVDWWSLGTFLYEMLTGITPFWAEDQVTMYRRVLEDELEFPEDLVGLEARDLISGVFIAYN
jgi:serine/threonine protein kinase